MDYYKIPASKLHRLKIHTNLEFKPYIGIDSLIVNLANDLLSLRRIHQKSIISKLKINFTIFTNTTQCVTNNNLIRLTQILNSQKSFLRM